MLKAALKKQELRRQNDIVNEIFDIVVKRVRECQKNRLKRYDVPQVFNTFPIYDVHKLYKRLKDHYDDNEYDINILDNQIHIIWEKETPKEHPEFKAILERINNYIEKAIDLDLTETIYDVPLMVPGIPLFPYEKTRERIVLFLRKEGFYVEELDKTRLLISWKTAKLVPEKKKNSGSGSESKPENEFWSGTDSNKYFNSDYDNYEKRLKKLKKINKQFKNV